MTSTADKIIAKDIQTTCSYCGVGCGIKAQVDHDQRSVEIIGSDLHPSNYGRLCSKGSALGKTVELSGRLLEPEVFGEVSHWDHALQTVADKFADTIAQHGPDSVAIYASGQLLTEDYYVANKFMKGFIGSNNIDTNSRLCMSSSVIGHKRAFGTDTVPGCYEDFESAKLITLVGSNTAWCHPVLFQRIKAYKESNPEVRVVVVDPRQTQTCDIADLHLDIDLGTDTWLFNGLLNYLNDNGVLNTQYLEQYTQGFSEALDAAKTSSSDISELAQTLNVDSDKLTTFFKWFSDTEQSITLYSQGVNQSSTGSDKVNSIVNCHLATGRIGREGMGPFSMTGQPNAMGGREVGGLANTLASHIEITPKGADLLGRFWNTDKISQQQGATAVEMFDRVHSGEIKAIWIMATNPVVSMPNADKVKEALEKCEFVVVSDCVADTDTLALADVKLPAAGWSEKNGTVTNSERRISRQRALFPLAGSARPDWWIISQVANKMGFTEAFGFEEAHQVFAEHARLSGFENHPQGIRRDFDISLLAELSAQAYDELQPFQWPLNQEHPKGKSRFFAEGDFYTPNRKARLLPITPALPKNPVTVDYPMRLNSGRIRDQWHTMTRTALAPQLNQHIKEPYIELHPIDAEERGIKQDDLVSVSSEWGQMTGRAVVTETVKAGDAFAPMHWTECLTRTGRVGAVVNPVIDPYSKQPESKHTPVQLSKFQEGWQGFVMYRRTSPAGEDLPQAQFDLGDKSRWPESDYLVSIRGKSCQLLELAGQKVISDPAESMSQWLQSATSINLSQPLSGEYELLSYLDEALGLYRMALIAKDGTLAAIAVFNQATSKVALPDRNWLMSVFDKDQLDNRTRAALLSGQAPAGEDIGRIVCSCFSVGEKTIEKAIKEQGLKDTNAVGCALKAGTNCGSCIPEIKDILSSLAV